mmetsp:Transcript_32532/g.52712  ORF Transcript_32532/g.52712 Transcript_32532/m.52712 type:complete len:470 (+) Transcript_32532:37-1446(+)
MADAFFLKAPARKRKAPISAKKHIPNGSSGTASSKRPSRNGPGPNGNATIDDEELSNESEAESAGNDIDNRSEEYEQTDKSESADEKRLRIAKEYLKKLEDKDDEEENVEERLRRDAMETAGRLHKRIAQQLAGQTIAQSSIRSYKGHSQPVTCVAVTGDDSTMYSGSKDCCCIRWDIETGKRIMYRGAKKGNSSQGHTDHVLSIAVSTDGNFLASGGADQLVRVWDTRTNKLVESLKGHRDSITGLAFRQDSHQLYSASSDRTVKLWNLDEMSYVETLFGHQAAITAIDSLQKERCVTSGGSDHSVRLWKVVDETQLVFRSQPSSIDAVAMLTEELFISGAQDGSLSCWNVSKKKPVCVLRNAHGSLSPWICSVAACPYTDLAASGSSDGFIRLWKVTSSDSGDPSRSLSPVLSVPVAGCVNGLAFAHSARFLVAGVGREHRLGRWNVNKEVKNGVHIIMLPDEVRNR